MSEAPKETTMQRIAKTVRTILGLDDREAIEAGKKRIDDAERKLRAAPKDRVRRALQSSAPALLLVAVVLSLCGCSAMASALGVDPRATAPAYSGVGVVVLGSPDTRVTVPARTDQSGAVGATGRASSDAEQTSSAEIPAEAVQAIVQAAEALLAAGQPSAAAALLARVAAKKPAAQPAPATPEAPPPGPAPTPATAPAPTSPPVPIVEPAAAEPAR